MSPDQEFYYSGGRKVPLRRDPDRAAVRYRASEPPADAAAPGPSRQDAESAAGAVERIDIPRRRMVILSLAPDAARARDAAPAVSDALAQRADVEFVAPVYHEPSEDLLLVPTDQINVRFRPDVSAEQIAELNAAHGTEIVRQDEFAPQQYVLRVLDPAAQSAVQVANAYYESELTEWAEPDFLTEGRKHALPNDPLLASQWHLRNTGQGGGTVGEDVHAEDAWDITTGNSSTVIAILDDGVDEAHPDLAANIHPDGYDFYDDDDDARPQYFAVPYDSTNPNDIHGTCCAGVATACGNNAAGVAGIAYQCRILPIKVWGAPNLAPNSDIARSIRYAGARAAVLSLSWSSGESDVVRQAIRDVARYGRGGRGVLVFCSSGNGYSSSLSFPSRVDDAIAVGASTNQGQRSAYSNYGSTLDFVAPSNGGTLGIWTTDVSYANRGYNLGSAAAGGTDGLYNNSFGGTSSACPLAAGIGALIVSLRPDMPGSLVRRIMRESCDKIGPLAYVSGRNDQFGHGRVNAHRALTTARAAPIGNRRSREMHRHWCYWYRLMSPRNKVFFLEDAEGLSAGYNGCRFCMREHDTG